MATRTPPKHIKHQQTADRQAWLRDELLRFATWLLHNDSNRSGGEEHLVDEYLAVDRTPEGGTVENPSV